MADVQTAVKKRCFVVMGFGKKPDFETGRTLDLDKSYQNIIKPAIEEAGLECIRADEIVHSGLIDVPMYEQLLKADVVVVDLSTSNKNAFYELGVRHALRPYTTVFIAEDGIKTFPFDVNRVTVQKYHHLGEDSGFSEAMRFRKILTDAVRTIMGKDPRAKDSPVSTFLNGLTPPDFAAAMEAIASAGLIGVVPPKSVYHIPLQGEVESTERTVSPPFARTEAGLSQEATSDTMLFLESVVADPAAWLDAPCAQLGERRPADLLGTDEEVKVTRLLQAVDQGLF